MFNICLKFIENRRKCIESPVLGQGVCCIRQMVVEIQLNGLAVVLFFSLDDFRLNRFNLFSLLQII